MSETSLEREAELFWDGEESSLGRGAGLLSYEKSSLGREAGVLSYEKSSLRRGAGLLT
jgi:hypothetical protein